MVKPSPIKAKPSQGKASKTRGMAADQVILQVMAKLWHRNNKTPDKKKVESTSQLKQKTFLNAITKLKQKDLLKVEGNAYVLTEQGLEQTGGMDLGATTNAATHDNIKKQLKGKYLKLFVILSDGEIHYKEDVAQALEFTDGKGQKGFLNMLGVMKNKEGLITYPEKNTVQLNKEVCFPFDD